MTHFVRRSTEKVGTPRNVFSTRADKQEAASPAQGSPLTLTTVMPR